LRLLHRAPPALSLPSPATLTLPSPALREKDLLVALAGRERDLLVALCAAPSEEILGIHSSEVSSEAASSDGLPSSTERTSTLAALACVGPHGPMTRRDAVELCQPSPDRAKRGRRQKANGAQTRPRRRRYLVRRCASPSRE
jgi:hypothetical protein